MEAAIMHNDQAWQCSNPFKSNESFWAKVIVFSISYCFQLTLVLNKAFLEKTNMSTRKWQIQLFVVKYVNNLIFSDGQWSPWSNITNCCPCEAGPNGGQQARWILHVRLVKSWLDKVRLGQFCLCYETLTQNILN